MKPANAGSTATGREDGRGTGEDTARDPLPADDVLPGGDGGAAVQRLFQALVLLGAAVASGLAVLALLGWTLDVEGLRGAGGRFPQMMPMGAVGTLLLALALVLLVGRPRMLIARLARVLAALAAMAGLVTLSQYVFGWSSGLDGLLFPQAVAAEGIEHPGRMQPATALSLLLLGGSLVVYDIRARIVHELAELLVLAVSVIALETLFGYAFGMQASRGLSWFPAMPIHSGFGFLALSVGVALLRTERGRFAILATPGAAGVALRRLIPVAVVGPFFIGWLTFLSVNTEFFSAASALTFAVSLMCVLLLIAVGWTTRELNRIDKERISLLRSEREARDQAEEASRAKSEFLGVMSHELRTPLNSVISYADILDAGIKGSLNQDQLHYVHRIRVSGVHLRSMIEELLQFTRAQRGAVKAEIRRVDAVEVAREALAVVAHEVDPSRIELRHQLPRNPVEVATDPDKVLHVLVNLLGNALKFTRRGRVGLRLVEEKGRIVYEVWDTGPGIAKEHREKIFQEFAQLETDGSARGGTGLGLAIGRTYSELLGGHLELDSWVGRGSVFRLVLPVGTREPAGAGRT